MLKNRAAVISATWVAIIVFAASASWAGSPAKIDISPPALAIGAFFAGKDVKIFGRLEPGEQVVVEIIGPKKNAEFHIKQRVGGLWMNHGKVAFEKAPFLYVLLLPGTSSLEQRLEALPIGLKNLKKSIRLNPEGLDQEKLFDQFFGLKSEQKLYGRRPQAIHYRKTDDSARIYETTFHFPASTIPGDYQVIATILGGNGETLQASRTYTVAESGMVKYIHMLAAHHELAYGTLSVIIALFVGAVIGVFFKQSGAH